jgi:hypothetical protein
MVAILYRGVHIRERLKFDMGNNKNLQSLFMCHLRLQEAVVNSDSIYVYRVYKPKGQRREKVSVKRIKNIMEQANYIHKIYDGFWEFHLSNSNNIFYLKINQESINTFDSHDLYLGRNKRKVGGL